MSVRDSSTGGVEEYRAVIRLFLRLLGLVYLAAFTSIGVQIVGLAGEQGILPVGEMLQRAQGELGVQAYWHYPTLFWISHGDWALRGVALAGGLFSLALLFGRWVRVSLILLFVLYLSLFHAGQLFMNFQWDYLLLEAGFLAIFLPGGSRVVIWLFRWLLFRLRFLSGLSKLVSQDPTWAGFTALNHYFETQPLPHIGAWYAHQLPEWVLKTGVGVVFFVELVVPFMMLLPRRFRLFAAGATVAMQLLIMLTSNHNYFNLLTIVLCLFLIDDRALRRMTPGWLRQAPPGAADAPPRRHGGGVTGALALSLVLVVVVVSAGQMAGFFRRTPPVAWVGAVEEAVWPFRIVNRYHVFPTIREARIELEVEGAGPDGVWKPYRFAFKPGDIDQVTPVVIPHQPRLDWMMWFVPMGHPLNLYWFDRFLQRLRENAPEVTALLAENPFVERPPDALRVQVYRYRFVDPFERAAGGAWWTREYLGPFVPAPAFFQGAARP